MARGFGMMFGAQGLPTTIIEFATVENGKLFVSGPGYLRQCDLPTRQWETQVAPWQAPSVLFAIGSRLFAANTDTIFELLDGARQTRLLASCRRKPATSDLDSFDAYGDLTLVPGPGDSVRAVFGRNIYSWDGRDWNPIATATNCHRIQRLDVFDDVTLLKLSRYGEQPGLWALPREGKELELCLADTAMTASASASGRALDPNIRSLPSPIWKILGFTLRSTAPAIAKSNLFVFVEHSSITNDAIGRQVVAEKDGRHADLVCLERGNPTPVILPRRFDLERAAPLEQIHRWGFSGITGETPTWLVLTADWLLFGQTSVPGVWAIPRKELDVAIARERDRLRSAPASAADHSKSQP